MWTPSEEMTLNGWYWFFKALLWIPIRILAPTKVSGAENVPAKGAVVLAGNHISYAETVLIPANLRRRVTFPAKAEAFSMPGLGGRFLGWFLRAIGQVPMDRSGGRASAASMDEANHVLTTGGVLGIFPEGTRSPDGRMYKGRTGVARLVLQNRVPVVPVASVGTEIVRGPLGIPYVRSPRLRYGRMLDFTPWADNASDREVLRWVTDVTMAEIQKLSGQRYVDAYASSVKSGILTPEEVEARVAPAPGWNRERPLTDAERLAAQTAAEEPAVER